MGFCGGKLLKQDKQIKKPNNCCVSEKKCHCNDESSFAPKKSKMKVLKKIKQRMGLGLYFHSFIYLIVVLSFPSFSVAHCFHSLI